MPTLRSPSSRSIRSRQAAVRAPMSSGTSPPTNGTCPEMKRSGGCARRESLKTGRVESVMGSPLVGDHTLLPEPFTRVVV